MQFKPQNLVLITSLILSFSTIALSEVSTECGGILGKKELSGQIAYKTEQNETFDLNERCMWTIRIPTADKITFDLVYNGLGVGTADAIVILEINETTLGRQYRMNATNSEQLTINANLAVVTFFSGPSNTGDGFILNYTGIGDSTHTISPRSRDVIVTEAGSLKHPAEDQELYDSNELSTFILSTVGFKENYTHIGTFNLTIEGLEPGPDGCDNDFIALMFFPFSGSWSVNRRYCDSDTINEPYIYAFPVLFQFRSDSAATNGRGFKLEWKFIENNKSIRFPGDQEAFYENKIDY